MRADTVASLRRRSREAGLRIFRVLRRRVRRARQNGMRPIASPP